MGRGGRGGGEGGEGGGGEVVFLLEYFCAF